MDATRRDVLRIGGLGVLAAAGVSALPWGWTLGASSPSRLEESRLPQPFRTPFLRPPVLRPWGTVRGANGEFVDLYRITERRGRARIIPSMTTEVWGYNGVAPGPTINVRQGRRALVRVRNHLPARHPLFGNDFATSVHLHGSASLPQFDGYANDLIPTGYYKTYRWPNTQGARTLWYHDHAVHHTSENMYSGLHAQYHIHDRAERSLLPQGEFDVPLIVVDANFASNGRLVFDPEREGQWGDVVLVNGRPWPVMRVKRRVYRFRVLNAAISRSFRFALSTGDPVTVVATDGGLMPKSRQVGEWRHAAAERYEVLIDFRRYRPGQRVLLVNLGNENNPEYRHTDKVMAFRVTDAPFSRRDPTWRRIPDTLVDSPVMALKESDATRTRHLVFERHSDEWTINDRTWGEVINSNFQRLIADPRLNATEIWEFETDSNNWFHPVHTHLVDFKILSRNGRAPFDYERGPKDTVYVGEEETVRVIMKFGPHRGRYMMHCHNTHHEDHAMMHQFAVGWKPGQRDPNDPMLAAPALVDNLPPEVP